MKILRFIFIMLFAVVLWYYISVGRAVDARSYPVTFNIQTGDGILDVAYTLEEAGLINNKYSFILYMLVTGKRNRIQTREFIMTQPSTIKELSRFITEPIFSPSESKITIIEGWTEKQIADELGKYFGGNTFVDAFLSVSETSDLEYEFLKSKPDGQTLEGYLFPDTYNFFNNVTAREVVVKLLDNFDVKFTLEMRQQAEKQGKSIHEIVTLASILEREVQTLHDKKLVADIFYSRMAQNVPLQADSTVNYTTGKSLPAVTQEDIQTDSLYNTYQHTGLPPGPISNPGLDSILAALYPVNNDYFYFLTKLDTGEVIYSRTFEEHVANKQKYLQ